MDELTEHEKLLLTGFGTVVLTVAIKWVIIIGVTKTLQRMADRAS